MLPSLIAREIKSELENFLCSSFPVTTAGFLGKNDEGLIEQFLLGEGAEGNLLKGPWLEVKLPFRTALGNASPLSKIQLGFAPYMHQQRAFERLAAAKPQSTLVATGTGSGKTECFLYPILNYCLQERRPGIKAIIVYPMNALATDQARRFAKEVAGLTPKLTVGMFTGDGGSDTRVMSPDQVITNHDTLRDNPPDILLTNYKMLDFLLMRPKDQPLWRHNLMTQDLLRYLVVDELHTFDGAQGTDLACLIRRLREKLQLTDQLACVGTSATIGGASACEQLATYASQIFATEFTQDGIILEDRLQVDEYLAEFQQQAEAQGIALPELQSTWPDVYLQELLPGGLHKGVYLRRQAELWLGIDLPLDSEDSAVYNAACVALGAYLHRHLAFLSLLRAAHTLVDLRQLAEQWQQDFGLPDAQYALALLDSLTALISTARVWADRQQQKVRPLLQVRVQLWLRELRRMLASVAPYPQLVHADDLIDPEQPLHLPVLHCRECHAAAWGAIRIQGERHIQPALSSFYAAWFAQSPDSVLLYPLVDGELAPANHVTPGEEAKLCPQCYALHAPQADVCQSCQATAPALIRVWLPHLIKQVERQQQTRNIRSDECPRCAANGSLMILGARAASLASVAIGQLYGSHANDDHKLIAFSDSVQDAAHRAGFFGARTYMQTVRQALAQVARQEGDQMALSRFIDEVPRYWQRNMQNDAAFVATFIAPNMEWLSSYQQLLATQGADVAPDLVQQVAQRLRWEALTELGLRARIGRTLERSQVAVIQPDPMALQQCVKTLLHRWQQELGQLQQLSAAQVHRFLLGFFHRLRQHGAFYDPVLDSYIRERGTTFLLKRITWLPGYGFSARPPAALTFKYVSNSFQNLLGQGAQWYRHWFNKVLATGADFFASAEYEQAMHILLQVLTQAQWFVQLPVNHQEEKAWLLKTERWQLVTSVASFACSQCGQRQTVALQQQAQWLGMPCLQLSCQGSYTPTNTLLSQQAYRTQPKRLITREHTGLLEGEERLAIEQSFIYGNKEWDVNLLSATPTLEMGIDIGDLSAVLLCSVPPAQANYLQRIGRAGRSNGNALALTIANGTNHDNYFYHEPLEMLAGDVATPGIFLNAMAVLERQLIAYCFDCWVSTEISEQAIPHRLGTVLNSLQASGQAAANSFPNNLFNYIEAHQQQLLSRFLRMFKELDVEGQQHLREFIGLQAVDNAKAGASEQPAGHTPLSWRVVNRLQELLASRDSHRERAAQLKKNRDALLKQPVDEKRDHQIEELARERSALLALISSINRQLTLNFFTDEGLLPNYAFPEEGVTLNSIIVRKTDTQKHAGDETESNGYYAASLKFQRPAQAALNELVPENIFYVSEHKISIEQVDLNLSTPSEWRLCPSCHYSEDVTLQGDVHSACPRCGDPYWADIQQKQTLLKLRQVYARANSRYDRIGDDSDQREPKFFQRQLLIDIDPQYCQAARRIDHPEVPFGFEFVRSAIFREVNFGEQFGEQQRFSVAGRESPRNGFQVCKHCGMVRRKDKKPGQFAHALDCKLLRSNQTETEDDWFSSLYLFRELKSEAIRILLPLADVAESETTRLSLIAAINLGLKAYFHGAVHHLEVTEMLEPSPTGNKQYLVIYDRIPGGTGYLKQLMVHPDALFTMLAQAQQHLSTCSCVNDESKDGCYRCILAYRNSRHRQQISRQAALKVLIKILQHQHLLIPVAGLSQIPTNHILESALEERLVHVLSQQFTVTKQRINNKPGYWIDAGNTMWELEPQVEFGAAEGVLETRADFVLRPLKQADRCKENEWIIYTDGFEYHWNTLTDDLQKRLSLMRSGRKVWVLTWDDLAIEQVESTALSMPNILLSKVHEPKTLGLWNALAQAQQWRSAAEIQGLLAQGNFAWLKLWLCNHAQAQQALIQSALFVALSQMALTPLVEQAVTQSKATDPESWREKLLQQISSLPEGWLCSADDEHINQSVWQLMGYLAPSERSSLKTAQPALEVFLAVNDQLASQPMLEGFSSTPQRSQTNAQFKAKWRAFWQACNVLQYAPRFSVATHTGLQAGHFTELVADINFKTALTTEQFTADMPAPHHVASQDWDEVYELSCLTAEQIEQVLQVTSNAPVVGHDLQNASGETIGTVELAWVPQQVALCIELEPELPEAIDWRLISLVDADWVSQLTQALGEQ